MKNAVIRFCIVAGLLGLGDNLQATQGTLAYADMHKKKSPVFTTGWAGDSISPMEERKKRIQLKLDSIKKMDVLLKTPIYRTKDTLDVPDLLRSSYVSLQQFLKGNVAGVYVQENSGEPGSLQSMLIRGISSPVLSNKDVSGTQPVVFLNGIPLLTGNSYLYNVKSTTLSPMGTATNILAGLNMNSVESIEVVKDPVRLAALGPLAANGAILVQLKDRYDGGSNIYVRASGGMALAPGDVTMTNAANERNFRMQFADICSTPQQRLEYLQKMPAWMSDMRDSYFYGKPDWASEYYKKLAPLYNLGVSVGGGGTSADYIFMVGYTGNKGVADNTGLGKFTASFSLNMEPVKGVMVNCLLNGTRMDRSRNRNMRDRYAEVEYLPDMSVPVSPVKEVYHSYLEYYEDFNKDDNLTNLLNGYLAVNYNLKGILLDTRLQMDYNADVRRSYWPSDLMESVSFVSNYSGYNRRLRWQTTAGYDWSINKAHLLGLKLTGAIQTDVQHYNYSRAYDGADDTKPTTSGGGFQSISRYVDKMQNKLIDMSANLRYRYKNIMEVNALFRYDGASNIQKNKRWLFSPGISVDWSIKNTFISQNEKISDWRLRASWARIGHFLEENRFGAGPQYTGEELTWHGQQAMSSYFGHATVARPYGTGWIGYNIGWPYAEKMDLEMSASFFKNRLSISFNYYNNADCDQIIPVPVAQEMGYKYQYLGGMKVVNSGLELGLSGKIFSAPKGFNWDASLSLAYNKNELKKLPGGYDELEFGSRKLKIGHSIDELWVFQNEGIYQSDEQVPTVSGRKLSMDGIEFSKGDPKWCDMNGDNVIDDDDKVMKGHILPPLTGNFSSTFKYGRFDLGFNLFFAVGHDALNYRSSQRYNFMKLENMPSLESVKEIFFWQNTNDNNSYPIYNQMSGLEPYRAEQDMFMEKLWYLKLRSLTFGYTLPLHKRNENVSKDGKLQGKTKEKKQFSFNNLYFYVTANNLFTITKFTGDDPELVDFDGYYRGYGQPLSRSVILGLKFNF